MRVLMLELDSLSLAFTRRHLDRLPTLRRLIDDGQLVETASTAGLASASVWPTFAMGRMPGEHGQYFPFQWHAETMRFYRPYDRVWAGTLDYEPFWYGLSRQGYECLILDAVQSTPTSDSPCLEINNWSAQSSGQALTNDPALLREMRRKFGKRPLGAEVPVRKSRRLSSDLLSQTLSSLKQKCDAIIWLGQSRDWQFYLAAIQDVHRAGHNLWPIDDDFASDVPPDALLKACIALDREIQRILDALADDSTHVILFTLNGMDANRAQNHFLPQVLERLNRLWVHGDAPRSQTRRRSGIIAGLRDRVPGGLQFAATRILGETVQDWVVNQEFLGALKWSETPAFPVVSGGEGLIRLNVRGRERKGLLEPGNPLREYIDWLKEQLLDIRVTRSGEPLVEEVVELQSHWSGENAHLLPDIALRWRPRKPEAQISSPAIGTIDSMLKTGRGGNHTGDSFALIPERTARTGIAARLNNITDYPGIVAELLSQA